MDEGTRDIQSDISWYMLFVDDVVLVDETRAGVNGKLELWKDSLESKGFKLSMTKTEYMMCDFNATGREDGDVSLYGQVVAKKETFRYLGLMLQKDGDIMKMLGIGFQPAGLNGAKLLASYVTRGCPKS
jgi:hypothetical protein